MSPHLLEETKVPVPCEDKDARSGPLICPPGDWYSRVAPALLAKLTQAPGIFLKQGGQLAIAGKPHHSSTPTTRSRLCSRPGRSQHGLQGSCSTSATQLPEAARPNAVPLEPLRFFFRLSLSKTQQPLLSLVIKIKSSFTTNTYVLVVRTGIKVLRQ